MAKNIEHSVAAGHADLLVGTPDVVGQTVTLPVCRQQAISVILDKAVCIALFGLGVPNVSCFALARSYYGSVFRRDASCSVVYELTRIYCLVACES